MRHRKNRRLLHGLVIPEPAISQILAGVKTWEMRSRPSYYRGQVALIRKGSGMVDGVARLVECKVGLDEASYAANQSLHLIPPSKHARAAKRWPVAWVLADVRLLGTPVPYEHKSGGKAELLLSEAETAAVLQQDPLTPPIGLASWLPSRARRSIHQREITLTAGNIRTNQIPLAKVLDIFPEDAIGGANRTETARRKLSVKLGIGGTIWADIDGRKKILRARGPIGKFFLTSRVRPGDVVEIERLEEYRYAVRLLR